MIASHVTPQEFLDFEHEGERFTHFRSEHYGGNPYEVAHVRRFYVSPSGRYAARAYAPGGGDLLAEAFGSSSLDARVRLSKEMDRNCPVPESNRQTMSAHLFGFARS